ncbi:MAG: agmatine deiminase [Desulfuromonadaceae bacterium]|nr:agmatine deiminase [Desulfuromonadaceae bacterium]
MTTHKNSCRLPAEWEPQDGVLLAWPHADSDWQPILPEIIPVYIELIKQISRFELVLLASPEPDTVRATLQNASVDLSRIQFYEIPCNDTWTRDFGPISIYRDGQPQLIDFGFNGWGLKFAADQDNQVTRRLHVAGAFAATPRKTSGLILEGGSIESDGAGTILTTSECLLNPNRNPHMGKQQLEAALQELLGGEHFLWLDHGYLAGDDTDSHIDTLARLCPNGTIAYVRCDDPQDEHYPALQRMESQLRSFRTRSGRPFRLIPLPWPKARHNEEDRRLPATYANFLIINRAVLVPTYNEPADAAALTAIGEAFPGREIVGIDCRPVIRQHGSLHCISMQIPQGVLS